ncbi:uncharacterized protein [Henckelia pumila]|uniref:uncharacterized protein n=1 Tax=Henckelia pumila TaxID=405737 RepID=UPI003C6E09D0
MCGNGVRCFARFIAELENIHGRQSFTVHTGASLIIPEIQEDGKVCPLSLCTPVVVVVSIHIPAIVDLDAYTKGHTPHVGKGCQSSPIFCSCKSLYQSRQCVVQMVH